MNTTIKPDDPVTMMFTDRVKPEKIKDYEAWASGIHNDAKKFQGFLSVDIIKPDDFASPEYMALIKFDCQQNMNNWLHSENVAKWVRQLEDLLEAGPHAQQASGLELWFSRPKALVSAKPPPFYKQVILGVMTVYPMILILNFVLKPVTGNLPWLVSLFISVVILSSLLTYPIMPWATKLLRNWLYPKSKNS